MVVGPAGWVGTAGPIATAVVVDDSERVDESRASEVAAPTTVVTMSTGARSDDEESDGGDAGVEPPHAASVVSATISQMRINMSGDQRYVAKVRRAVSDTTLSPPNTWSTSILVVALM